MKKKTTSKSPKKLCNLTICSVSVNMEGRQAGIEVNICQKHDNTSPCVMELMFFWSLSTKCLKYEPVAGAKGFVSGAVQKQTNGFFLHGPELLSCLCFVKCCRVFGLRAAVVLNLRVLISSPLFRINLYLFLYATPPRT